MGLQPPVLPSSFVLEYSRATVVGRRTVEIIRHSFVRPIHCVSQA